jgi:hypothetical protein
MAHLHGFIGLCIAAVAAGCAHTPRENPMVARAAANLTCDARSVRWQPLDQQVWIAHGCGKQAKYAPRCHEEFENPARPTYPPITVCEWFLEGIRPDVLPPVSPPVPQVSNNQVTNPPR